VVISVLEQRHLKVARQVTDRRKRQRDHRRRRGCGSGNGTVSLNAADQLTFTRHELQQRHAILFSYTPSPAAV
jgi:hypothetical protein